MCEYVITRKTCQLLTCTSNLIKPIEKKILSPSQDVFCILSVSRGMKQQSLTCSDVEGVVLRRVFFSMVRKDAFDHLLLNTCLPDKTQKRDDL